MLEERLCILFPKVDWLFILVLEVRFGSLCIEILVSFMGNYNKEIIAI